MNTDKFGEHICYLAGRNIWMDDLASAVSTNGFEDYSDEGISSYLTFRHPIGNTTMFKGYRKLPFGVCLEENKQKTFWYPEFGGCSDSIKDSIENIDSLLRQAIGKLVNGKRKVAVAVSGGLDSSLVVGILRKTCPDMDIYTYSAGFHGDDEFEYSRLVAAENGTIHKEKVLGRDDYIGQRSLLKDLIRYKASPLHPNELALAKIEKMAKDEGCDIVLCGEGADDIFGGYGQNLRMYLDHDHKQPFFKFFLDNYRYFSLSDRKIVSSEYLVDDYELLMSSLESNEIGTDMRNWVLYFTQKIHTPGLITRGANAMRYNGLPLGFPYIDDELVEYVNSLSFDYKVMWRSAKARESARGVYFRQVSEKYDIPKFILKKVAERYLNKTIIYRSKKGFPVPFDEWFGDLSKWDFASDLFVSTNISQLNGWKKFMLINLDVFAVEFSCYKMVQ